MREYSMVMGGSESTSGYRTGKTFSEIHLYGAGNFARRLRTMIENALQSVPEARVPALRQELDLLDRAVEQSYKIPEDLARARAHRIH